MGYAIASICIVGLLAMGFAFGILAGSNSEPKPLVAIEQECTVVKVQERGPATLHCVTLYGDK